MERLELKGIDTELKSNLKILAKQHNMTVCELVEPALNRFVNRPDMIERLKHERQYKRRYEIL